MTTGSVNATNLNKDLTVRVYDNFYRYEADVPAAEYDVVHSYFLKTMSSRLAAGNFTVALFRIAQETNTPALTLLKSFEGTNGVNLNAQLAYYLNQIRSIATQLGVSVTPTPNRYAQRNVLQ
jgi:hypothetical protein|nr:hypothetical protein [Oxalobacteraceae bacterium]